MNLLKKAILFLIILCPIFVFADAKESDLTSVSGIIKEFNVGRVSIENVGYTRYSNLLSSGSPGIIIKGIVYNNYTRDVQLKVVLKFYDDDKNKLQEFSSLVRIEENKSTTYQQNIYLNELAFKLDDIKYFSLEAELGTDVEILEKGENDIYYLEDYFVDVNVNENNVYNVEKSFIATFRNKIVEIESGIPFRQVYIRNNDDRVSKRAIISNIVVDDYYKISTNKGVRTLTIGKLDKSNTKKNYNIKYDYNVGEDTLSNGDEFVFYLVSNYDVKVDGLSFRVVMPKEFDSNKIYFVDKDNIVLDNVEYEVNGNVITGNIDGIINPQVAYAIKIDLEDNYFNNCTKNISNLLVLCIVLPIVFVFITLFSWFVEKKQKMNREYKGNILFNKNLNSLEIGYLYNGCIKDSDIATLIFTLANKGYLYIEKLKKGYKIVKKKDYTGSDSVEKIFMKELFDDGNVLYRKDLSISLYNVKNMIKQKLDDENRKNKLYSDSIFNRKLVYWFMIVVILIINITNLLIEYQPSVLLFNLIVSIIGYIILLNGLLIRNNIMEKMIYTLVSLILIVTPIVLTSYEAFMIDIVYDVVYVVGIICMIIIISIVNLMSDKTKYGRMISNKIYSYKDYLINIDRLSLHKEYRNDKNILYKLLPNALVLGVSDRIVNLFSGKVLDKPEWYVCKNFDLGEFYKDFKDIYSDVFIALKSSESNLRQ